MQLTGDWKMYKGIFQSPPAQRTARHLPEVHRDPVFHEGHVQNSPLARRAVGPLEISGTTGPTRQGHPAFAVRTLLSHQFVSHRLVALCRLGRIPRLDRQVLWHMLPVFPGSNQEARVRSLWLRIQELYKVYPRPACLNNMT